MIPPAVTGLNKMKTAAGDKKYFYDANGNLVEKETREGMIKYNYTTDNRLKGVYYPDGSLVEYEYDALRRKASRHQGEKRPEKADGQSALRRNNPVPV
ncbi:hypothetical protein CU633_22520 [Bacillus sp. V3-13]|uniref:RHS repeat protein n=1 Tax=Bacillus sp. V3-13 TaxID=2053728 RepID=UPI000C76B6DD|nr:RHS repeat protein [Bacillus sp. V3-13]PLR75177.1 hypothetical protein CU633_22520 [Bacillus sp. V3-13]